MVGTIERPEGAWSHAVIAHLIGDLLVLRGNGDEDTRRDAVNVLYNAMLIENAAILLQLEDLVEVCAAILRGC